MYQEPSTIRTTGQMKDHLKDRQEKEGYLHRLQCGKMVTQQYLEYSLKTHRKICEICNRRILEYIKM